MVADEVNALVIGLCGIAGLQNETVASHFRLKPRHNLDHSNSVAFGSPDQLTAQFCTDGNG